MWVRHGSYLATRFHHASYEQRLESRVIVTDQLSLPALLSQPVGLCGRIGARVRLGRFSSTCFFRAAR